MKNNFNFKKLSPSKVSLFRKTAIMALLLLAVLIPKVQAQTKYIKSAQTWDNSTTAKWSTSSNGTYNQVWVNGTDTTAVFEQTAGTITIGSPAPSARVLNFNLTGFVLSGTNTLTLTGVSPVITSSVATTEIDCPLSIANKLSISGSGVINFGPVAVAATSPFANMDFTGGFVVNTGVTRINCNNTNAFGTSGHAGEIVVKANNLIISNVGSMTGSTGNGNVIYNNLQLNPTATSSFYIAVGGTKPSGATAAYLLDFNGAITEGGLGTSNVSIGNKAATGSGGANGSGATRFSNSGNSYKGQTILNLGKGYLQGGVDNFLPTTTQFVYGDAGASQQYGTLDLNGYNVSVGSIETNLGTGTPVFKGITNTGASVKTITINGGGTSNSNATFAVPIGAMTIDAVGSTTLTGTNNIALAMGAGSGSLTLTASNTFTGGLTLTGGNLIMGVANALASGLPVTLNGGTLTSGATIGFTQSVSTLNLTNNSTIVLGTGSHTLTFAASNGVSWTSNKTITITGWTTAGSPNGTSNGNAGKLFVGNSSSGLTSGQLAQIIFVVGGTNYSATQLSTGEVVPVCNAPVVSSTNNSSPVCAGTTFSLSTSATGTATLSYSWGGPNSFTSTSQNPTISSASTAATGTYTVTVTNGCGSTATATTTATVNAVTPSVSIATSSNTICSGTSATFTATPTNGGTSPTYIWTLNGGTVGNASNTYTNSSFNNGDVVACTLTSNATCISTSTASSNTVTISIGAGASQPSDFTTRLNTFVYQGQSAVSYTVANVSGVTYNWSFSGTGATINGTGNSVTVDYSTGATTGTLSVTASNTCGTSIARSVLIAVNSPITIPSSNLDYSFVTLGCNRVDYLDTTFSTGDPNFAAGKSTANVYQLNRVFTEISHLSPLPKYLVMTGDIVMGYKGVADTAELVKQLTGWRAIYENHPLSQTGITLIALPGNHETQNKAANKTSYIQAEQIFVRVMAPYIHGSNGPGIGGPDGLTTDQSHLTYSFNSGADHFIIIDTDPVGKDNTTPYKWIGSDIQAARAANARHIFAFGHKPAYSSSYAPAGGLDASTTLAQRDSLWKYLEANNCEAMFSAHEHVWDTIHPHAGKTWQVINGNGGTRVETTWTGTGKQYYGYTLVNLYTNKTVNVMGLGRNTSMSPTVGTSYTINEDANPTTVRNSFNICLTTTSTTSVTACNSYVWNATTYTTSGTYTYTLVNGNAAGCDSVATLNLTMSTNASPSVSITTASNTICAGSSVTFTATPTNGGTSPMYVWALNSGTVGTNSTTFTTSSLNNNDVISCTLNSNLACASPTTASSNSITISILNIPNQPNNFTTRNNTFVYQGQSAVSYTVANVSGVTYNWSFSGIGATINGTGNSVTVDYSTGATTGTLSVTASNTCGTSIARSVLIAVNSPITIPSSNLDYSFVTLGCNRVDYLDTTFSTGDPNFACGASTANVYQLNRVFTEISHLSPLPKYLVMTGDIVMGYKGVADTAELVKQLRGWRAIYESHPLSSMGITLIAIPGNHETQNKAANKTSYVQAEQIFVREMAPYIHGSNGPGIGGPDGLTTDQSKLTYSFNSGADHFIIIDTDPVGKDNTTPYKWIGSDIQAARAANARHIFAFGHKPAYSSSYAPAGGLDASTTLAQRDSLWKYLEANNCEAMFSAHEHVWDTIHPHAGKTWQVINGNGGTRVETTWTGTGKQYYGYTLVNLYTNKTVNVMGLGRNTSMSPTVGTSYTINEDANPTTVRNNFNICLTTTSTISVAACNSYVWNATTYTNSGTYTYKTTNSIGCDSIATLALKIKSPSTSTTTIASCPNYVWNATTYSVSGIYTYTTTNAVGCDSIATLALTINPIASQPGVFTVSSSAVIAGQNGVIYTVPNDSTVTYTWNYSGSGATISGSRNSVTLNFATSATSGTLGVTATNSCGSGIARSIAITVSPVFTAGNIAVLVENTNTTNNTASIIELNTNTANQSTVNTYTIPSTLRFTNAPTSHFLSTSDDGTLLVFTAADTTSTTVDASSVYKRAVGTFNPSGMFNLATTYQGQGGATLAKIRSATTINDSTYFIGDKSGFYSNGTTTPSPAVNILSTRSFGGTVYALTASSTALAVGTISAPVSGTYTPLSTSLVSSGKSNDFYMLSSGNNGSTYDILYILDNNTSGLISKYSLVGGVWVANGTYTTSFNGWAIAAQTSGSGANLYVTSGTGATANNSVIKLTDAAGYNSLINIATGNNVTLYTATGTAFIKGIAFAPACNAPAITSVSSNGTVCSGSTISLTATATGSHGRYTWTGPNGFSSTSQNPSINNVTTAAAGIYSLTISNVCGSASATVAATVKSAPSATISANGSETFCSGGSVTLTAASGTAYSWSNGATTQAINTTTTGNYSVTVTGSNGCTATSTPATIVVNATVTPSVTVITNTGNTICNGTNVTFTASAANGGTSPHYQWKLNGNNVGKDSIAYINGSLNNNDQVTCRLTSNAICATTTTATSTPVTITISGSVVPSVSISSGSGNTVCSGATTLFTAVPTNGGSSPSYQWKLNGTNVGSNSTTYSNSSLNNNDTVKCIVSTSNNCATVPTATSNNLVMTVTPTVTPWVSVSANPGTTICTGSSVVFTATPTNGGTPAYQWIKNGVNVGTNSNTYNNSALANHDTITCVMTSTAKCATSTTVTSTKLGITVNAIPTGPIFVDTADAVNPGQTGVKYAVQHNPAFVTPYTWGYSGLGATITSFGDTAVVNFSANATSGALIVSASNNSCGTPVQEQTLFPVTVYDQTEGVIRITEYMYSGTNGEFIELTNVSDTPVDMSGWSFDDNANTPGATNLIAFGIVQPGESVIVTETIDTTFRKDWNLCSGIKIVGGNVNHIGRDDQINLYNASQNLVDRLNYGDNTGLGGVRTQNISAWVTAAGLGMDNAKQWTLSTVGDLEGSVKSIGGDIGSPGKSTRAVVSYNPCLVTTGGPSIVIDVAKTSDFLDGGTTFAPATLSVKGALGSPYPISGVVGDSLDPASQLGFYFTISDSVVAAGNLTVTATSSNTLVIPNSNLILSGTGSSRNLKILPASNFGYSRITLNVNNGTKTSSYVILYAVSLSVVQTPALIHSQMFHSGTSDASDGIPLDDHSFITGDDNINVLSVFSRDSSGLAFEVLDYDYASQLNLPAGSGKSCDVEVAFRSMKYPNRIYFSGSMSNSTSSSAARPNANTTFAVNVTGSGINTSISVVGSCNFKNALVAWGDAHGYDFTDASANGVFPKANNGFDIEGMTIGPDSTTLYIGFRAPQVPMTTRTKALIAPLLNFETWFNNGNQNSGNPSFGAPIELDLGLRGIRDIIRLSNGTYIISAGDPGDDDSESALFKWTGNPSDAPIRINGAGDGILNMEGVMEVHTAGSLSLTHLEVINDCGSDVYYTDNTESKYLSIHNHRKFTTNVLNVDLSMCTNFTTGISASGNTTFNVGSGHSVTLTANSGTSYLWSNGATTQAITVSTISGNYSVTVTSGNNCTSTSAASTVTVNALVSDINLDGITNVDDFLLLLGKYNQLCTCPEDLDHNGIVNVNDFLILLGQFGETPH